MTKILKIAIVSLAVLGGVSAASAGGYDKNSSVLDKILAEQSLYGK